MAKKSTPEQQATAEPVYFMDLVVENVKCFKNRQTMDLSDGKGRPAKWTIILGENGTGKTTLLRCLVGMIPDELTIRTADGKIVSGGIAPKIPLLEEFYPQLFFSNPSSKIEVTSFSIGKLSKNRVKNLKGYSFTFDKNQTFNFNALLNISKQNINYSSAYGASRRMGKGSLTETKTSSPHATLFDDNATLINAEAWLLETDFAMKSSSGETNIYLQKQFEKIKDTLKKLLPDVEDFRIKEITKTQTQAAIEVKTPYGWVAMKELSFGYQTFIAWVVDLAARLFERYPESDDPLAEPAIVLVDEIDLHLHPKWQRNIVEFLNSIFVNTQFIVTAHSPLIVQAAEDANLVLLKREGDRVKIHNNVEADVIWKWRVDQLLTSDLFDLPSARPPKYDKLLERQQELLDKDELNDEDENELEQIGKKLEELPPGESASEALEALRKAAEILKSND